MDEDAIKAVATTAFLGVWMHTSLQAGLTRIHANLVGGAETVGGRPIHTSWLENQLDRRSTASISPRHGAPPRGPG